MKGEEYVGVETSYHMYYCCLLLCCCYFIMHTKYMTISLIYE